ncbi:MAG: hypothetical protein ABJA62_01735 [Luteimonas sp.]
MIPRTARNGSPLSDAHLWLAAFAFATIFLVSLYACFEPRWETNDDVALSMATGGYGLAASGTPNLIFSNVVWGFLVRLVPAIGGTPSYSITTICVLILVGAVIARNLVKLGSGVIVAGLTTALVLVRPMLHPQFTLNAGLLTLAAVTCWALYARDDDRRALLAGCVLALLGYLVRSMEFMLVLGVALPLLPLRELASRRAGRIASASLAVAIAVCALIDYSAYRTPEWVQFQELNSARVAYTDFEADARLRQRPDIMARYGYSDNDINLITHWFFVDRNLVDPARLKAVLNELGWVPSPDFALIKLNTGLRIFWNPELVPIFLAALLLGILRPRWQIAAAWMLCIAAVAAMSVAGRPGVTRVCMPLACLLLVSTFFPAKTTSPTSGPIWRHWLGICIVLAAVLLNSTRAFSDSIRWHTAATSIRASMAGFPSDSVVAWGSTFPFQPMYPLLGSSPAASNFRLYSLGALTWAPYTVSYVEQMKGRGLLARLIGKDGVPIVATDRQFTFLSIYCKEHLNRELETVSVQQFGNSSIRRVRCLSNASRRPSE